ncbi:MAG: peptide chain release factor N(5)-glutamine methyltransferase [Gloeomargarita sp. SKYBB_i_bin120]|nr:peptide chain release factor N(5)-glutamine methyltransferase [Gloeomargarita sp. SKYG98]MCS7293401.1 peptide chain release factor N(5)-glutamine methyltransferase [Gloeomargarita sp. SKYB120]MDW8178967.1 peptide chain release factor N(5)-glutamine methyltransferase [Gloeomargarita sp. SKYBB_i_bin120]
MVLRDWWRQQQQRYPEQAAELDWLVRAVTGWDTLTLRWGDQNGREFLPRLQSLWRRYLQTREPVQYLVGWVTWRDMDLQVAPGVLIPRPETELLVDIAKEWAERWGLTTGPWADLGVGSGAIALGLLRVLPGITMHGVDCSATALEIARANAARLQLMSRLTLYQGCWFEPLVALRGQLRGIVSNPPYIPTGLLATLPPEVQHEPRWALDGGPDGLVPMRHLVATAPQYLQPGGLWCVETMSGQTEAVVALLEQQGGYRDIQTFRDWGGHDRFVLARWSG